MRFALAQINTTVGDLVGNIDLIIGMAKRALEGGARVVVFPELAVTGYPPRDLLEKPSFYECIALEEERLATKTAALDITLIYGSVRSSGICTGKRATNVANVMHRGETLFRQTKMLLPTYDVFDEGRYFLPAEKQELLKLDGCHVALTVCEDAWNDKQFWERRLYQRDPVEELAQGGAQLLVSINASPFHMGKRELRREMFSATARHHRLPVIYVNQVGGNDQLVFDGSSFAMNRDGEVIASACSFQEDLVFVDPQTGIGDKREDSGDEVESVYQALVLGARDYIHKCGFRQVLMGLSGGIDSSLTAAIAVDAIGAENVVGVGMPGPYSSAGSIEDARAMAGKLGIRFELVEITSGYQAILKALDFVFGNLPRDVTEENIQARLRGLVLMSLSNKWGAMVLTTGNKSELAVGYCTLYGDMCGGLAVISDVPKTLVYELARVANTRHNGAIPESVFSKPPSAELRPDQKDSDSLPEYHILDPILRLYVEDYLPPRQIAEQLSLPLDLVREVINKVDRNEYKRHQAAPGLKVTSKAFGMGRRFPIAQRFSQ
jgi:NAD+ synthase/NAD+ synthase (glutamine-hydrolysing)